MINRTSAGDGLFNLATALTADQAQRAAEGLIPFVLGQISLSHADLLSVRQQRPARRFRAAMGAPEWLRRAAIGCLAQCHARGHHLAKNTDWDALFERGTALRNLRRHCRQVWSYLNGQLVVDGGRVDLSAYEASYAALVYPTPPSQPARRAAVEDYCGEQLVTVIWFDELPACNDELRAGRA